MTHDTNSKTTVAFVGAGRMGAPMATRLLEAGFVVRVWNRSPERVASLEELGAIATSSPAQAATGADVLVTMLPDGPLVEAAMSGPQGALGTLRRGERTWGRGSVGRLHQR